MGRCTHNNENGDVYVQKIMFPRRLYNCVGTVWRRCNEKKNWKTYPSLGQYRLDIACGNCVLSRYLLTDLLAFRHYYDITVGSVSRAFVARKKLQRKNIKKNTHKMDKYTKTENVDRVRACQTN